MSETVLRPDSGSIERPGGSTADNDRRSAGSAERLAVTAVVTVILVFYAVRGGSYDIIVRGEAGVAIWWVLMLGAAFGLLPRRVPRREALVVLVALGVLVLWTTLAFGWTESDERTSLELARLLQYGGLLILVSSLLRFSTVGPAIAGAAVAGVAVCGLALASRLWPSAFPVDRIANAFSTTRLSYPLNYWNGVAAWGSMATAMTLAWSAHARRAVLRAAALASAPLCITVVYLTYSRAGVAGIAIGAAAALALARARAVMAVHVVVVAVASFLAIRAVRGAAPIADATGTSGRGDVLVALLVGAALCAAVAVALHALDADERLRMPPEVGRPVVVGVTALVVMAGAIASAPVIKRGINQFNNDDSITEVRSDPSKRLTSASGNRRNLWSSALAAYRSDPLKGTGPGTFEFWWNRDRRDPENVRDAHSLYLETLAESGIVGLIALLTLCGALLVALVRFRLRAYGRSQTGAAAAALAGFIVWLFQAGVDWMWEATAVTAVALVLGAAGCASRQRRRMRPSAGLRAGAAVVALVALGLQVAPLVGMSEVRASASALAGGDEAAALRAGDQAVQAWPWAASPYAARARALEAGGRFAAARRDAGRARAREPTNWRHPLFLARIAAEQGRPREALRAFAAAARLRPLGSVFR